MELEEAKKLLDLCEREELRDHAFGDREIFWTFMGVDVAGGYLGATNKSVWIVEYQAEATEPLIGDTIAQFYDRDASQLVDCGKLKKVERNDMQGDDIPSYRGA